MKTLLFALATLSLSAQAAPPPKRCPFADDETLHGAIYDGKVTSGKEFLGQVTDAWQLYKNSIEIPTSCNKLVDDRGEFASSEAGLRYELGVNTETYQLTIHKSQSGGYEMAISSLRN